jgi:RNA polymerase sigma-70 factor (ECF subfamily)
VFASDESGEVAPAAIGVDDADFERFYTTTGRRTLAVAYALTNDWAVAEDLVQDAYVAAHRSWAKVGSYDDPAAWVRRVVANRSASRWRRLARELRAVARLSARTNRSAPESVPADQAFWEAVRELPGRQRQVVALFYLEDLSVTQVAERLQCSEGTVKAHLSRARVTLHQRLTEAGLRDERDEQGGSA